MAFMLDFAEQLSVDVNRLPSLVSNRSGVAGIDRRTACLKVARSRVSSIIRSAHSSAFRWCPARRAKDTRRQAASVLDPDEESCEATVRRWG